MALATWWASDPLMDLTPLSGFHVALAADDPRLATLNHISVAKWSDGGRPDTFRMWAIWAKRQ